MDVSALGGSFDFEVGMRVMRDGREKLPGQERSCGTAQPAPGLGSERARERGRRDACRVSVVSRSSPGRAEGEQGAAAGLGERVRSLLPSAGDSGVGVEGKFVLEGECSWVGRWDVGIFAQGGDLLRSG